MFGRRVAITALLVMAFALPNAAVASTPPLLNWGELIPGFTPGLDLSDSNICKNGSHRCVESVIRKMNRDLRKLARDCDHNAIFQLGYTRTTEAYYESTQIDGFYDDVPWMHHYDAVFASYYTQPQQAWNKGRISEVPPAWREAFSAADSQELTALGNFLMGMNAHINRDLPFVLTDIGLTDEDGNSRKPDHERVNEFLNNVADDMGPEIQARFDPEWSDSDPVTGFVVAQVIQEWRERAWNAAWLMTYADDMTAQAVAEGIESGSAAIAELIRETFTLTDEERDARNAYCEANGMSYDGFDGTYFDDPENDFSEAALDTPEPDAPVLPEIQTLPLPEADPGLMASLGIQMEVSIQAGVELSISPLLAASIDATAQAAAGVQAGVTSVTSGATTALTSTTGLLFGR